MKGNKKKKGRKLDEDYIVSPSRQAMTGQADNTACPSADGG